MLNKKTFNKLVGDSAEEIALKYLQEQGYKILKKNFKTKIGEIDIIAKQNDYIVFVEVKYRTNDYFGMPREAVNYQKQRKIRMVATQYLKYNGGLTTPCRFDVLEILGDKITHIPNCF